MKKILCTALLALVLAALLTVSAFAADAPTGVTITTNEDTYKTYTVSVGGLTAGSQYLLLVFQSDVPVTDAAPAAAPAKMPTPTATNVVYVNQDAGAAGGTVTFSNFLPKSENYWNYAYIAGGSLAEAQYLGVLGYARAAQDLTIGATVTFQESAQGAAIQIKCGDDVFTSTTTNAAGTQDVTLPVGTGYTITITKPGFCSYTLTNVTIDEDTEWPEIDISSLAGDVRADDTINGYDILDLLTVFNKTGVDITIPSADLNEDASVDGYDLLRILGNFNNSAIEISA